MYIYIVMNMLYVYTNINKYGCIKSKYRNVI